MITAAENAPRPPRPHRFQSLSAWPTHLRRDEPDWWRADNGVVAILRYYIIPTLWATARRLCRRGRPGSTLFAEVLAAREAWRRPVDSDHELRLERAMRRRGFPPLTRQYALVLDSGEVIHPDLGLPDDRFFVEVDHLSWHGGRWETAYDRRRDRRVRASGYHVERVTDIDLDRNLCGAIEDLWTIWQRICEGVTTA